MGDRAERTTLFVIECRRKGDSDDVDFETNFPNPLSGIEAFKVLGMTVVGVMQTAVKLGESQGLSQEQVLSLMNLPTK